jgi:hypothetical protein
MKKGFGILEVLAASVVLAFMLLGLNALQKGNREGIIRVRARDTANTIAQEVIDSIAALGPATVVATGIPQNLPPITRKFKGAVGEIELKYDVTVSVDTASVVNSTTSNYQTSNYMGSSNSNERIFAKNVDVTVEWKFKNSDQSINMSTLIR